MSLIYLLLVGLIAGTLAKMITPQDEKGGWVSSIVIGIVGSFVGHLIGGIVGIQSTHFIGRLLIATGGAVLVLFIYHRYLVDKLNLPV